VSKICRESEVVKRLTQLGSRDEKLDSDLPFFKIFFSCMYYLNLHKIAHELVAVWLLLCYYTQINEVCFTQKSSSGIRVIWILIRLCVPVETEDSYFG